MRALWAVVLGAALLLLPGDASAESSHRPRARPLPPLATSWPAREDCPSYGSVDVSVDDRVSAVEWRGPNGASLELNLPKVAEREKTESYRLGSDGLECHFRETSCILYRDRVERERWVRPARTSQLLATGFVPGSLDELVLHEDVRQAGPPSRADKSIEFGLRLVLHCADQSKPSIAWACDANSCVPRTFRDNVGLQAARKREEAKPQRQRHHDPPVAGPYHQRWDAEDPARDLGRLICMRGSSGRAQAVRAAGEDTYCWGGAMPAVEGRAALVSLARDLLAELDNVLEDGCAGACSARVDELRATERSLAAAPDLHLRGVHTLFHPGEEDDPYGAVPSLGIIAKLDAGSGAVEVACARYKTIDSAGDPIVRSCRMTVSAHSRRLGEYAPDWRQKVELPDGGAVHVSDLAPGRDEPATGSFDHVVIIGSALAQRGPPVAAARQKP